MRASPTTSLSLSWATSSTDCHSGLVVGIALLSASAFACQFCLVYSWDNMLHSFNSTFSLIPFAFSRSNWAVHVHQVPLLLSDHSQEPHLQHHQDNPPGWVACLAWVLLAFSSVFLMCRLREVPAGKWEEWLWQTAHLELCSHVQLVFVADGSICS